MRTDGQTDRHRHDEGNNSFSQFWEKPSKSPDRIAGTQPIFEPGTYWIRNTSANRSAETLGSRFIDGPPCTFIYYPNATVAQNVCYFVTTSCSRRRLPDFPSKIPPSTTPISRTLVQLRWRENSFQKLETIQWLLNTLFRTWVCSYNIHNLCCIGTRENNSNVKTAKFLINKNHGTLISINIKNCTYKYFMLGNFFRRSMDHKQLLNKQQLPITPK